MKKLLLILSLMAAVAGCGREPGGESILDLVDTLKVSPRYEKALAEAMERWRAGGALDLPLAADLVLSDSLVIALISQDEQQQATNRLWLLLKEEPDHSIWNWIAISFCHAMGKDSLAKFYSHPPDSSSTCVLDFFSRILSSTGNATREASLDSLLRYGEFSHPRHRNYTQYRWAQAAQRANLGTAAAESLLLWLPNFHAAGGSALESKTWAILAQVNADADKLDTALRCQGMALRLASRAGLRNKSLMTRIELASLLETRGWVARSREELERAKQMAEVQGLLEASLFSNYYLMNLYSDLGENQRALDASRMAVAITEGMSDCYNLPLLLLNQVGMHLKLGQLDSCPPLLDRAQAVAQAHPDAERDWIIPTVQSEYWFYRGDYEKADSLWNYAESIQGKTAWERRSNQLILLAQLGLDHGHFSMTLKALDHMSELGSVAPGGRPGRSFRFDRKILTAHFHALTGAFDLAEEACLTAEGHLSGKISMAKKVELSHLRGLIELLTGDLLEAELHFREALGAAEESELQSEIGREKLFLARSLTDRGETSEARRILESLDVDFERYPSLRIALLKKLLLGELYLAEGRFARALECANEALDSSRRGPSPDLTTRFQLLRTRALAGLGKSREAEKSYRKLRTALIESGGQKQRTELRLLAGDEVREAYSRGIAFLADTETDAEETLLLLGEMRALTEGRPLPVALPANSTWTLHYMLGDPASFLWIQSPDGLEIHTLPSEGQISAAIAAWNGKLSSRQEAVAPMAGELAGWLLGPIQDRWKEGEILNLVLDGALHDLPWAALPWGEGILLDHGLLVERGLPFWPGEAGVSASHELLALGFDEVGEGSVALTHSEREARQVASVWPGEATLLTRATSSGELLEILNSTPRRAIHLATHSRVHPSIAGRSYLRFPGPEGESQFLAASDIASSNIRADLVYLSCCEGGRGVTAPGGAVSNLARAFQEAGADAVISSPVPVSDEASRLLAAAFYRYWNGGLSAAEALRQAQMELRCSGSSWSRPRHWAYTRLSVRD